MPVSLASSSSAAMHGSLVPIVSGALTSAPVNILNIPQTYQDLQFVVRMANSSANFLSYLYFGAYGSVYSGTMLYGNGSSAISTRYTNDNQVIADSPSSLGMVNSTTIFGAYKYDILNYTNTTTFKTVLTRVSADQNGSGYTSAGVHLLRNTSAITDAFFTFGGGAFSTGSTFTLYGVRSVGQ
jgi:hypothetical protein